MAKGFAFYCFLLLHFGGIRETVPHEPNNIALTVIMFVVSLGFWFSFVMLWITEKPFTIPFNPVPFSWSVIGPIDLRPTQHEAVFSLSFNSNNLSTQKKKTLFKKKKKNLNLILTEKVNCNFHLSNTGFIEFYLLF